MKIFRLILPFVFAAMINAADSAPSSRETSAVPAAAPASAGNGSIVLGGGCFWCVEAAYQLVPGVVSVTSGYAGGSVANPAYKEVCTGRTGHAEVVRVEFDAAKVSLERLLDFFWVIHDPTTLNRQGADAGTQYRSVIFYADDAQRRAAESSLARANPGWGGKIVTEIKPLAAFYRAEEYHQDYFRKNPNQGYCRAVIRPKIDKLKKAFAK
ncbi:MAG: peptide-methionine (S)-S-oxide reductase MsrA [Opitutaceae bacterium]|jgi:peptide-methionine (S)-S-oxide reductase|nr:peptide-methionine (S)-S-oxide reductase MsrA [Opitutaceae bacterium]